MPTTRLILAGPELMRVWEECKSDLRPYFFKGILYKYRQPTPDLAWPSSNPGVSLLPFECYVCPERAALPALPWALTAFSTDLHLPATRFGTAGETLEDPRRTAEATQGSGAASHSSTCVEFLDTREDSIKDSRICFKCKRKKRLF